MRLAKNELETFLNIPLIYYQKINRILKCGEYNYSCLRFVDTGDLTINLKNFFERNIKMKKIIITISVIFFVALNFASNLWANKPSEAERFEVFIKNKGLVKSLEFTEEQITKLKTAVDNSYFPHGRNGKPGIDPPPEEGFKMDDDFRKEIYKILTPKQKELVLTYKFQLDGGFNANALYATKLEIFKLSNEQLKKLREIEVERSGKYQEILKFNRPKKNKDSDNKDSNNKDSDSKNPSDKSNTDKNITDDEKKNISEKSLAQMKASRSKMKEIAAEYNEKMKAVLNAEQIEFGKKLTEAGKGLREKFGIKSH
jgi:Spy/CpxP family protein refolding chaperone